MLCWVRYVVHLLLVLALVLPAKGPRVLRSLRTRNQVLRGVCMLAATLSFFTTLSYLPQAERSEEHTSELQSLMRISYAVFCLKKKKNITNHHKSQTLITNN